MEDKQNKEFDSSKICNQVRDLIRKENYITCYNLIVEEMKRSPHSPYPHNLLGMLLEQQGNHTLAMKHFRASWALDPTYLPARHNLEIYGTFYAKGIGAYDENDCPILEEKNLYTVEYDNNHVGHFVRREKK